VLIVREVRVRTWLMAPQRLMKPSIRLPSEDTRIFWTRYSSAPALSGCTYLGKSIPVYTTVNVRTRFTLFISHIPIEMGSTYPVDTDDLLWPARCSPDRWPVLAHDPLDTRSDES
jgi:hypothetical protein